jgi:beta-carotene hydroxylase
MSQPAAVRAKIFPELEITSLLRGNSAMRMPTAKANRVAIDTVDMALLRRPAENKRNPTLWLFACAVVVFVVSTALWFDKLIARTVAAAVATACLYCLYTVSHEAAHGTAHKTHRVNAWLGRISAAIEGMTFPLFRIIHLQHHAYTNHPVRDPDFFIGRSPRVLLPVWTLVRLTQDNQFMVRNRLWSGRRRQLLEHLVTLFVQAAAITAGLVSGGAQFVFWGWLLPIIAAGAMLQLTVAWAVHYPHASQHPLEHTRMIRSRVLRILTLNQACHLVHHLWPRIPWFRYGLAADAAEWAVARHREQVKGER